MSTSDSLTLSTHKLPLTLPIVYVTHHHKKLSNCSSIVYIDMSKQLQYMHAEELASKLSQKSVSERESDRANEIAILDVRSEDEYVEDGHIRGAVNLPSTRWYEGGFVDRLVREHMDAHSTGKTIVLHCAYSQQRGPTCARLLLDGFDRSVASSAIDAATVPQIYILKGGFVLFCGKYGSNLHLVDGGTLDEYA